jgi:sulfotransferase
MSKIIFLSGLPRTGSTLLTSILSQNPKVEAGANSALCQVMWDMQVSCESTEQMQNRPELQSKLISKIPEIFYGDFKGSVVDKCRSWTLPANLELINKYITQSPKIIVMLRPIVEIVKSFVFVRKMNGWVNPEQGLLDEGSEPIMRSLDGIKHASSINSGQFGFYWYENLVTNPESIIDSIYEFCGLEKFKHDFNDIQNLSPERDDLLDLIGLHDIRPTLERRTIDIKLSDKLHSKALQLDNEMEKLWLTTLS